MSHEGSFLEATNAQFEAAVTTELAASMDASAGARLLHKLALCRLAVAALRDATTRVKRIFWLANHTTGCNWSTVAQLKFREEHDANAVVIDPHFTPLATWEDQVKAAIIGAKKEKAGLTKDGKALVGPIAPSLQRLHVQGRSGGGGDGGGAGGGNGGGRNRGRPGGGFFPSGPVGSQGGGYRPPGSPYGAWWDRGGGGGGRGGK